MILIARTSLSSLLFREGNEGEAHCEAHASYAIYSLSFPSSPPPGHQIASLLCSTEWLVLISAEKRLATS